MVRKYNVHARSDTSGRVNIRHFYIQLLYKCHMILETRFLVSTMTQTRESSLKSKWLRSQDCPGR